MKIIIDKGIALRTMVQSFDIRALKFIHEKYPDIKVSYLVPKFDLRSVDGYIKELGFKPDVFSPEFSMVTEDLVKGFHAQNIPVIPWTPNTVAEIQRLKNMGVDGVITDYPDLFAQIK